MADGPLGRIQGRRSELGGQNQEYGRKFKVWGGTLKAHGKFAGTRASEKDAAPGRPAAGSMRLEF